MEIGFQTTFWEGLEAPSVFSPGGVARAMLWTSPTQGQLCHLQDPVCQEGPLPPSHCAPLPPLAGADSSRTKCSHGLAAPRAGPPYKSPGGFPRQRAGYGALGECLSLRLCFLSKFSPGRCSAGKISKPWRYPFGIFQSSEHCCWKEELEQAATVGHFGRPVRHLDPGLLPVLFFDCPSLSFAPAALCSVTEQ